VFLQHLAHSVKCYVVNVYGLFHSTQRRSLWQNIVMSKKGFGLCRWCILSDFNTVRSKSESKGVGVFAASGRDSNLFIQYAFLMDLPILGQIKPFAVRVQNVKVSCLQHVDDIILIGEAHSDNLWA